MTTATLTDQAAESLPLHEGLARWFPRRKNGQPYHVVTAMRWATDGCGPQRIKLRVFRCGSTTYLTKAAAEEFLVALNGQAEDGENHA